MEYSQANTRIDFPITLLMITYHEHQNTIRIISCNIARL